MHFPNDWPADCPPRDAEPASGDVYRLVKTVSPSVKEVGTHHEKGTLKNADACLRCGLSVFRAKKDALHQFRAYPRLGMFIAKGTLNREDGFTKKTGTPTHTTWWAFEGVDRLAEFDDIEEII